MTERSKLYWRCRRGMLELDLLLQGFVECGYDALNDAQKACFNRMLALPDQELLEYLMARKQPTDGEMVDVIERIRGAVKA